MRDLGCELRGMRLRRSWVNRPSIPLIYAEYAPLRYNVGMEDTASRNKGKKRVKGFAPWKPQRRSEPLVADVEAVLEEYAEYLPLTIRQVFYRLVSRGHPKTENFYATVQEVCNRARRSGRISFRSIRDDGVSRLGGETLTYDSPEEYYAGHDELHNFYERSWHADQPAHVAVLCEASGMVPMLERAVRPYRVEVASSSGFDSLTAKHDLFTDALGRYGKHAQRTVLLHFGDHDPSGVSVYESMAEDLEAFCRDHDDAPEELIEVRRVALVPEQILGLGITTQPDEVKPTDSRSKAFIARGLEPAAQLEAIPPDRLSEVARLAVESALDLDVLYESRARERREQDEVQEKLDEVNEVLRGAFGPHE